MNDDSRRLAAIRAVLARFDWEHDDRQYALEEIERIAGEQDQGPVPGGPPMREGNNPRTGIAWNE